MSSIELSQPYEGLLIYMEYDWVSRRISFQRD
jgi:hypothetical protein